MRPGDVYLATVCIEKNRWAKVRTPSIDLESWLPRIAGAGFDGVELWEHHATALSGGDVERVAAAAAGCSCPVEILNTYVTSVESDANVAHRRRLDGIARRLGAKAYKFNLNGPTVDESVRFARAWADEAGALFLCECHPRTIVETSEAAAEAFRGLDDRFAAILHTLSSPEGEYRRDLELKRERFRHVHVQDASAHWDLMGPRVAEVSRLGLELTWSIEFSAPVRAGKDAEACFAAAVEDMKLVRSAIG